MKRLAVPYAVLLAVVASCGGTASPSAPTPITATSHASAPDPSRFQQDVLLEGVFNEPTEIAVAHDGRVFIVERHGTFSVYDPKTRTQRAVQRLVVNDTDENGLIGITLDPGFDRNHWIYMNRTVGDHHRLARFTFDGDSLRDERA